MSNEGLTFDYLPGEEARDRIAERQARAVPVVRREVFGRAAPPVLHVDTTGKPEAEQVLHPRSGNEERFAIIFEASFGAAAMANPTVYMTLFLRRGLPGEVQLVAALPWAGYETFLDAVLAFGRFTVVDRGQPAREFTLGHDTRAHLGDLLEQLRGVVRQHEPQADRRFAYTPPNASTAEIVAEHQRVIDEGAIVRATAATGLPSLFVDLSPCPEAAPLERYLLARLVAGDTSQPGLDTTTRWAALFDPTGSRHVLVLYVEVHHPFQARFHVPFLLYDPRAVEIVRLIEAYERVQVSIQDPSALPQSSDRMGGVVSDGAQFQISTRIADLIPLVATASDRATLLHLLPWAPDVGVLMERTLGELRGRSRLTLHYSGRLWSTEDLGIILNWPGIDLRFSLEGRDDGAWRTVTLRARCPAGTVWALAWRARRGTFTDRLLVETVERQALDNVHTSTWLATLVLGRLAPRDGREAEEWLAFLPWLDHALLPVLMLLVEAIMRANGSEEAAAHYADALNAQEQARQSLIRDVLSHCYSGNPFGSVRDYPRQPVMVALAALLSVGTPLWNGPSVPLALEAVHALNERGRETEGEEARELEDIQRQTLEALVGLAALELLRGDPPTAHPDTERAWAAWGDNSPRFRFIADAWMQRLALGEPGMPEIAPTDLRWLHPDLLDVWRPWLGQMFLEDVSEALRARVIALAHEQLDEAARGPYPPVGHWVVAVGDEWPELHRWQVTHLRIVASPKGMHLRLLAADGRGGLVLPWAPEKGRARLPAGWCYLVPSPLAWELFHFCAALWRDLCVAGPAIMVPVKAAGGGDAAPRVRGRGRGPVEAEGDGRLPRVLLPRRPRVRTVLGGDAPARQVGRREVTWGDAAEQEETYRAARAAAAVPRRRVQFQARRNDGGLFRASDEQRERFRALPEAVRLELTGYLDLPPEGVTYREAHIRGARGEQVVAREAICQGLRRAATLWALRDRFGDPPADGQTSAEGETA